MGAGGAVLSIIVPTYNEKENVGELLKRIDDSLRVCNLPYEVIIVDDGSSDGTAEHAEKLSSFYPVRVIRRPGRLGLSSAVIDGVRVARGSVVAVMDADLQHPPEMLPRMLKKMGEGHDIIVASRYVKGGSIEGWSALRKLISKGAVTLTHLLLPKTRVIRDPVSGFFLLRKKVIDKINPLSPKGFKILLEVLVRGRYLSVAEVPYRFGLRKRGGSKLSVKQILNYVFMLLRLKWMETVNCR
jgi:dolichol-phosphate mannosyltransferase